VALTKPAIITVDTNVALKRSVIVPQTEELFVTFMFRIVRRKHRCFLWTELGPDSWKLWVLCIIYFPVFLNDQYLRLQRYRGRTA